MPARFDVLPELEFALCSREEFVELRKTSEVTGIISAMKNVPARQTPKISPGRFNFC